MDRFIMKKSAELKVGDLVEVWWKPKKTLIMSLRPHPKYNEMFGVDGAMIGDFSGIEMTIEPHQLYKVFLPNGAKPKE
jgi:hypothetical protein